MTESIINALVHLFAIIESVKEDHDAVDSGEVIIKPYLSKVLNQELTAEYLRLFYDYLSFYREANIAAGHQELSIDSTSMLQVAKICNQLNKELVSKDRVIVLMQLIELIHADHQVTSIEDEFISLVAMNFNVNPKEVQSLKSFIIDPDGKEIDKQYGMVIDNKMTEWPEEVTWMMRKKNKKVPGSTDFHHLYIENLFGTIRILWLASVDAFFFKYIGPLNLFAEGNKIVSGKFYQLNPGAIIKGPNIRSIYESEITSTFLQSKKSTSIVFVGEQIEYKFNDNKHGIHPFSFSEKSGNLIGIMGGSGVGKSTLVNLLNGKLEPTSGRIHINGHSIFKAGQSGVIGYVPQDDLLFEELTVFENLYFNAQICFSEFNKKQLLKTVQQVMNDLDLNDIKDLKVGDPLNKFISGGQRKRLNIALELMREPAVLFVDEPTSGLSSMDSEKVMQLLKKLARTGKLVFTIIHQPSSDIFKLFDKLWILDKGGYPIYNGNPIDAVVYFKTMSTQVNAAESECTRCGNVIPEQILQIIEAKEIDDSGEQSPERRVKPVGWYQKYQVNLEAKLKKHRYQEILPPTQFHIPNLWGQFRVFSVRNLYSKLSNTQYILINLLEAPVLALILAYFSKYYVGNEYIFAENKNLPVYLFMAVVVALFMGMSVSAEDIFKDRKILERESFLNLSRFSYINSKIVFLFGLSGIQMLAFVAVGNYVLEIHDMSTYYWIILFSASCFANLVGLNISSALNSIITIYILIPFILVPQLLLGGAMIKFDELHKSIAKQTHVPIVGDIMVSRWAYEALAVAQFKYNNYQTYFFDVEKEMSEASFQKSLLIPRLEANTRLVLNNLENIALYDEELSLLKNETLQLQTHFDLRPFAYVNSFDAELFNASIGNRYLTWLSLVKDDFQEDYEKAAAKEDSIYQALIDKMGKEQFLNLKSENFNESLAAIVENKSDFVQILQAENNLIQKKDPIYFEPKNQYGLAHFYAPVKKIGSFTIPTLYFNLLVIWLMNALLYLFLWDDTLKKILKYFSKLKTPWNKKY